MSVSLDTYIELYDLNTKRVINTIETSTFDGFFNTMDSLRQTGINFYDGKNYYLFYGYITYDYDFIIKKMKFPSSDLSKAEYEAKKSVEPVRGKTASCYITDQQFIGCITIVRTLFSIYLSAYIYDINLNEKVNAALDGYSMVSKNSGFPYFIKCIHLKGEVGVFAFYRSSDGKMVNYPVYYLKNIPIKN